MHMLSLLIGWSSFVMSNKLHNGVYALWANRVSTKKSIGTYPFQLVYRTDVVFPSSLGLLVMKYIQEEDNEPNPKENKSTY